MYQVHLYAELLVEVFGKVLGRIYGAVLAACTAETYGQVGKSPFHIPFHGCIYQPIYVFEEYGDFPILFKEADNGFVETGERLVTFVFARVVYGTAVEYETAAVAGRIFGDTFFIGETGDFYYQTTLFQVVGELFQFGQFVEHFAEIRIFGVRLLQQLAQVFNGERHALDEVGLLLEVTAETVCAQYLHGAEQYEMTELGIEIDLIHRPILAEGNDLLSLSHLAHDGEAKGLR